MKIKLNRLALLSASAVAVSGAFITSLASCSCGSKPANPVEIKTLEVERKPNKKEYIVGEKLDLTGIVVNKVMDDGSWVKLEKNQFTTEPAEGTELTKIDNLFKVKVILNESPNFMTEFPISVVADPTPIIEQTGKVVYEEFEDGYEVTGLSNASEKIKTVTVETTHEGKPVIQIKQGALANCPNIENVTLPFIGKSRNATGIEAMFGWVFGSTMFEGCGGFTWQEYDVEEANETVTKYGSYCIPLSVVEAKITDATQIAPGAFSNCKYLNKIEINEFNAEKIGNKALYGCTAINSFSIANVNGLKTVEHSAFQNCATLQYINLPSTVTNIEYSAFANCVSCARANIPKSVQMVESNAFSNIPGVILVESSESEVTSKWASDWTEAQTPVVYDFGSESSYGYDKNWFVMVCGKESEKYGYLVQWMGSWQQTEITVPSKLTINDEELPIKIIGGRCFQENTFLTHVEIEEGVEHIFGNTFEKCTNLKYVDFPQSLKSIREEAFYGCSSLVGHLENGNPVNTIDLINVKEIGNRAFSECTSMLDLNLEKVETIGEEAFAYCTHLCPDTTENPDNCLLIPATCTSIGKGAFKYCFKYAPNSVTTSPYYPTVKFGDNNTIKIIPESCFERCGVRDTKPKEGWDAGTQYPKQIRVNINLNGAHLTRIENAAFKNCWIANLKGARNTHIEYIGDYAFYYAQPTSDLDVPGGKQDLQMDQEIKYIGEYAFAYCTTVKSLTFNTAIDYDDGSKEEQYYNSLEHLGQYAFYGCSNQDFNYLDLSPCVNLKNYIAEEYKELDPSKYPAVTPRYSFAQCTNLHEVYLPGSYHYLDTYKPPLSDQKKAEIKANFPCENFTRLPERFFEGCTSIGKTGSFVTLPQQITDIRAASFNGCNYLQKVFIDGTINFYGSSIFNNNYNLESITRTDGTSVKFDEDLFANDRVGSSIYSNCYKLTNAPMPIISWTGEKLNTNFNLRDSMYYQNKLLSTITLPYNCYSIGTKAFMNCDSLTTVTFKRKPDASGTADVNPNVCYYIYSNAFSGCKNLTSINLEDTNIRYIYGQAFENCTSLSSIKLPAKTITFYSKPFEGWKNTQTIQFNKKSVHNTQTSTDKWWTNWTATKSTWPNDFYWDGNRQSSSIPLHFVKDSSGDFYTCEGNACGGTNIKFVPYF